MINNFLIIGFGNIGKRHFESIYNNFNKINIYIIDPYISSFKKKKINKKNIKIHTSKIIDFKNIHFKLIIISTNAKERNSLSHIIVNDFLFDKLILEKVPFNQISSYKSFISKIKNSKKCCYVNYPRNIIDGYIKIKKNITRSKPIILKVIGYNWGIASNSFHFLSLFGFFNNWESINIEKFEISEPFLTKRNGYYDFNGKIHITTKNKHKLIIEDNKIYKNINYISIENNNKIFFINEKESQLFEMKLDNKLQINESNFDFPFQSNLTFKYIKNKNKNYLQKNDILLNYKNEIKLLKKFSSIFSESKKYNHSCPIT
tara:strand:- start:2513 stop:3463 length:951 start_codon:yes stop_codon:yes gene_type:complete